MKGAQRKERLLVIGATGGIGRALVEQAKERGHRVTAFVRSPEKLVPLAAGGITVRRGDPLDATDLRDALPNHDAVLSALVAPGIGHTTVHRDGASSVVTAMGALGMRRLLVVSGAMLFKDAGLVPAILRRIILRNVAEDLASKKCSASSGRLKGLSGTTPSIVHLGMTRSTSATAALAFSRSPSWA
jgi:NAD(P)-dependent dehydrogenase (short-subunit alcohol dehydrogenase family)